MRVLVIGGGIGGCSAIVGLRKVDKNCEIILVEPKDHCEIFWAAYRSPFEKWVAEGSIFKLKEWAEANKVQHVRSTVAKLTKEHEAVLANGDKIKFDVAVVATGATSSATFLGRGVPSYDGTKEARVAQLLKQGEDWLNVKSILICGGGLIGTELAGDLASYAKKARKQVQVTLVHSGPFLSHAELTEKASNFLQKKLEKLGVKVILNEKAIQKDGKAVLQNSGSELQADEIIYTTGLKAVNEFMKEEFSTGLAANGFINADEFFRVTGSGGRLFAIGDCSNFLPNSGYQSLDNSATIGKNIKATLDALGKNPSSVPQDKDLVKGKASYQVTLSTVGPKDGVFYTPAFFTQYLFPRMKNGTMFLFRPRMELGFKKNA